MFRCGGLRCRAALFHAFHAGTPRRWLALSRSSSRANWFGIAKKELRKFLFAVCGSSPEWHDMMVARNRFSSQNESPKEPVHGTENILTSEGNTYRKACIERKKATFEEIHPDCPSCRSRAISCRANEASDGCPSDPP